MRKRAAPSTDPAHDILRHEHRTLDTIFAPRFVAVIGAAKSTGSVGRTLLWNLIANPFGVLFFLINPKRKSVLGIEAYPNMVAIPELVVLSVVATPTPTVLGIVEECAEAGVRGATDQGVLRKLHFGRHHISFLEVVLKRIVTSRTTLRLLLKAVRPTSPKRVLLGLTYTLVQYAYFAPEASSVLTLLEPP